MMLSNSLELFVSTFRVRATFCVPHCLSLSNPPSLFIALPATEERLRHLETPSLRASAFTYATIDLTAASSRPPRYNFRPSDHPLTNALSSTALNRLIATHICAHANHSAHTTTQMPPQKTAKAGRRGKRGAWAGGGRKKKSNPPASEEPFNRPTPTLIVRLKVPVASLPVEDVASNPAINHDEDNEDVGEQLAVVTTRSGRAVRKKQDDAFLYEDDYKSQLASSPPKKASDEGGESTYQYRGRTSTRK
jgi:hypothetical protein